MGGVVGQKTQQRGAGEEGINEEARSTSESGLYIFLNNRNYLGIII